MKNKITAVSLLLILSNPTFAAKPPRIIDCGAVLARLQVPPPDGTAKEKEAEVDPAIAREYATQLIELSTGEKLTLPEGTKVSVVRDEKNQVVTTIELTGFEAVNALGSPFIIEGQRTSPVRKASEIIVDQLEENATLAKFVPAGARIGLAHWIKAKEKRTPALESFANDAWKYHARTMKNAERFADRTRYNPSTFTYWAANTFSAVARDGTQQKLTLFSEQLGFELKVEGTDRETQTINEKLTLRFIHQTEKPKLDSPE